MVFNLSLILTDYTEAIKRKESYFMTNILKSQTVKIALGIIIGFGVIALIIFMVQAAPASAQEISQNEAKQIALKEAGVSEADLLSMSIVEGNVDGVKTYDISFTTSDNNYSYDVSRSDGKVLGATFTQANTTTPNQGDQTDSGTSDNSQSQNNTNSDQAATNNITEDSAKQIALKDAGVSDPDYIWCQADRDDGRLVYEVEFVKDGVEYDYEIAQSDGKILAKDYDAENYNSQNGSSGKSVTLEEAKAAALARVSGATDSDIRIHEDHDDGRKVFEGEIYYNGMEYEFEIDANTGNFIEWSAEDWH